MPEAGKYMARILLLLALAVGLLAAAAPARAGGDAFCASCHPQAAPLNLSSLALAGGDAPAGLIPCPGVRLARRELNLTQESLTRLASMLPRYSWRGMDVRSLRRELKSLTGRLAEVSALPIDTLDQIPGRLEPIRREAEERVFVELAGWDHRRGVGAGAGVIIFGLLLLCLAALVGLWALREYDARPQPLSQVVDGGAWLGERRREGGD